MGDADIHFYWDPICPFAWITSEWIRKVVDRTGYVVDWRFIALRILNEDKDYETEFPPEYPRLHGAGLRLLRVAASVRAAEGRQAMDTLYRVVGASIWDQEPPGPMDRVGEPEHVHAVLESAGFDVSHASAADDTSWDVELRAETEEALSRTGRDVGTPIIAFRPPDGPSFFGPVISRVPDDDEAVELWEAVITLATFPGFAELKRSLREIPQLTILGGTSGEPIEQDWKAGSRTADRR